VSNHFDSISTSVGRRRFCFLGAASAIVTSVGGSNLQAQPSNASSDSPRLTTGNGEWTYTVVSQWGSLPEGKKFGGTHGAIATDKAGNMYISTQSDTGILVYSPNGQLLRQIATDYPEVHSMHYAIEDGNEVFYTVVQRGTPKENWLFLKMKTDGSILQKITAPAEAGFKTPNEWRITSAVPGPDGSIFIANGYGDSRIFRFDKQGNYKSSFAGKGDADGLCNCSHGLAVDIRYEQPLLLVCDRENFRLSHFDFDGKFVRHVTQHMRRPCQVSFHGENAVVSELQGRVTVLDKNNVPVAFLGDNPNKSQWAGYRLDPNDISAAVFSAAHGCHIDVESNIYVSDWNKTGRITKLQRHAS
jgi:sugar lactone lactonase YvrE